MSLDRFYTRAEVARPLHYMEHKPKGPEGVYVAPSPQDEAEAAALFAHLPPVEGRSLHELSSDWSVETMFVSDRERAYHADDPIYLRGLYVMRKFHYEQVQEHGQAAVWKRMWDVLEDDGWSPSSYVLGMVGREVREKLEMYGFPEAEAQAFTLKGFGVEVRRPEPDVPEYVSELMAKFVGGYDCSHDTEALEGSFEYWMGTLPEADQEVLRRHRVEVEPGCFRMHASPEPKAEQLALC